MIESMDTIDIEIDDQIEYLNAFITTGTSRALSLPFKDSNDTKVFILNFCI